MQLKNILLTFILLFCISHISYAELLWSPKPFEKQQTSKPDDEHAGHQHGQHTRSKEKGFYLQDNQNVVVQYIDPSLKALTLAAKEKTNKYILPKTGMDNYHALVAERKTDSTHESSLRYPYMRGKPSGHSPDSLVQQHKLPLEIVPQPMIREHWRFYTNNSHQFQLLFENKPLVDTWLIIKTSNGTSFDAKTDASGKVTIKLPDDFKDIKPGRRANKPAEFSLRTVHIANNITYKTNFSAPYSVNPSHWQSNTGGLLALSIGFISGLVIMRRHNRNNPVKQKKKQSDSNSTGSQA